MKLPLQITFRDMEPSSAIETAIREKAEKLERFYEHVMSCRVIVETVQRNHNKGNLYHVRVDLTVPDGELVASRDPGKDHSHEDLYVALRDAFNAVRRQLEQYARRRRQDVKTHEAPPHGRVLELVPMMDYGRILAADGREIYFHRNSVLNAEFDQLELGDEVRFDEEEGEQGPQATSVRRIGKHHIVG